MEYGRLVVLGYSSYRVASKSSSHHADRAGAGLPRSPSGVICTAEMARMKSEKERRVIGQIWEPIGDQNAQYKLTKRSRGNGVKLRRFHHIVDARASVHSVDATKIDLKVVTKRMLQYIDAMQMQTKAHSHTHHSSSYYMCVPMSDTDVHASVTEYVEDDTTDMYQIGRMPCVQNDVVIPGPRVGASGTVSRFCARVLCTREAPFECRIFAGGFDGTHKMVTAGHALKRCGRCGEWSKRVELDHKCVREMMEKKTSNQEEVHSEGKAAGGEEFEYYGEAMEDATQVPIDGLTKNGVRVWLPEQRRWFEVSVNGNLYEIAPRTASASTKRSHANPDTSVRHSGFNRPTGGVSATPAILTDGAIIDLGGVQLQFQSRWSNQNSGEESLLRASMALLGDCDESTSDESDSSVASKLDRMNVQCPVQMHQLRFHRAASGETIDSDQVPHVFPACGHVFGFEHRIARSKMCPLCRKPGNFVRLLLKENFQLMSSAERSAVPECVFNPCGHAISSKLAVHYSGLLMPNGRAICPFCAVHLDPTTPYSRLYLYSEDDNGSQLDQQHEREQATST